jgi:hypothetical protein
VIVSRGKEGNAMAGLVIGVAALALILRRQVRPRPLAGGYVLVIVLGVIGLAEAGSFLFGTQQFVSFLKGHQQHLTLAVPDGAAMLAAAAGSLALAAVTGALRAPSVRLWRQDGQVWREGTGLTVVLWLASLALHLGYDALVARGKADAEFGAATMLLYFAVSLTVQNIVLRARAYRLRDSGRYPASAHPGQR